MSYIVAVNGSCKNDGNTAFLLKEILKHCKNMGAETEIISAQEALMSSKTPYCVNCSSPCEGKCFAGTKLEEAYNKIEKADFVLFGSPVYFGSMSAQLKAFFDKTRVIRGKKAWLAKPGAGVSVGFSKYGGQERTLEAIHSCMLVSGMTVIGNSCMEGMGHFGVSAQDPADKDEYAVNQCRNMALRIMDTVKKG